MKKNLKFLVAVVLLIGVIGMVFTGCSVGKPTVNLNDYVKVTEEGYDGYGKLYASVDFDAIVDDYSEHLTDKSLDTQYFGNKTPELAAKFVLEAYDPYALAYNAGENMKNGDKIEFTWNTNDGAIEQLSQILEVSFAYDNFTHVVEGLGALKEIDPFENVTIDYYGISGDGSIYSSPSTVITLNKEGDELYIDFNIDESNNSDLSNGDTIHMAVTESYHDAEYNAKNYGVVLTRTEADVELNGFAYYAYEDPAEIVENLGGKGMENALSAITDWVEVDNEDRTVEFAGALYYYQDEGNEFKNVYNTRNQLLLIYHIDNGKVPGGWYTYLAPNNNVIIGYERMEDGAVMKATMLDVEKVLSETYFYYQKELYTGYSSYNHPITFEYDGVTYVGHQTIEDCINAYEKNELEGKREYAHVVASEGLSDYVPAN